MTATIPTQPAASTWRADRRADQAAAAEQRRQDEIARAEQRRQDYAAQRAERRQDQAAAEQRAADRKTARQDRRRALLAGLPNHGMSILWATLIVAPITLAWNAQAAFASETLHISGPFNHLFPLAVEVGAWVCAFEAHRRRHQAVGRLTAWMWILAGVAAVINASHGTRDAGVAGGLALGAMSLLGVLLHSIRQGLDAEQAGGRSPLRLVRLVRFPGCRWPRSPCAQPPAPTPTRRGCWRGWTGTASVRTRRAGTACWAG
uniref:hypothetical protein n=1 Tax=Saccharothrix espanaensis TaxID=103731 RepID=UPI003F492A31